MKNTKKISIIVLILFVLISNITICSLVTRNRSEMFPALEVVKASTTAELEKQMHLPIDDEWYKKTDDLLLNLLTVYRQLAADYLKKIHHIEEKAPAIHSEEEVVEKLINKDEIIKKLEVQFQLPRDSEWHKKVSDLIFDLAIFDRQLANSYLNRVYEIISDDVQKIAEKAAMSRDTSSIAPPTTTGGMKKGAPPTASGTGGMKKGAPPTAPKGGPGKNGSKKSAATTKTPEAAVKEPKIAEQIFSIAKLSELDNEKLLELFNGLLDKLPSNWNGQAVERIEEKTKYGSKVYNVYGIPIPKWSNDIGTLKKVLIMKNIMTENDVTKKIIDRINFVRSEKNKKTEANVPSEEKPKEELTEGDIINLIKILLAEPKTTEIGWVVSTKGNIKALDKMNHEKALEYHDQFINLTKERPFLKK
ncbi:MAG TPA: hypothetical protein VLB80_01025 [Candidatus Babeliales bacterium]|nr:hypothetical protein [Candidatus Babeliales bacterium]